MKAIVNYDVFEDLEIEIEPEDIITFFKQEITKETIAYTLCLIDFDCFDWLRYDSDFLDHLKERHEEDLKNMTTYDDSADLSDWERI